MKNIAVILAGGSGKRMGGQIPKQFLPLAGRSVLERSVSTFDLHPAIDEVAIVVHPEWRTEAEQCAARCQHKPTIIDGGAERYMSSINAIMAFIDRPDDTNLLLHDAARPLLSAAVIDRVVAALQHSEAVGVAVPCNDTIWEVHPDIDGLTPAPSPGGKDLHGERGLPRFVARTPERRLMWQAQTPQAFRLPLIRDAYQRALQDPQFAATDDCSVVRRYMPGIKITVVEGEYSNFKLTCQDDLRRAETELQHQR